MNLFPPAHVSRWKPAAIAAVLLASGLIPGFFFSTLAQEPLDLARRQPEEVRVPLAGEHWLRILTPTCLELTLVEAIDKDDPQWQWNLVSPQGKFETLRADDLIVTVSGKTSAMEIADYGFKRRALYAPLDEYDLRVASHLYLKLTEPLPDNSKVTVTNPAGNLWTDPETRFEAENSEDRFSPAIHVNQAGYPVGYPKRFRVGYYLGSLGELPVDKTPIFTLRRVPDGKVVYGGTLTPSRERDLRPKGYQDVLVGVFTQFNEPGEYVVEVPGLGRSYPFYLGDHYFTGLARTYSLGLLHQRCGVAISPPFSQFTHGACHTTPASVPTDDFKAAKESLSGMSENFRDNPDHTAPQLKSPSSSLYPFVRQGQVDVSGGHHDAGDYSKYTINSAQLIHALTLAADAFPGAADLDGLDLPESGDGQSDLIQIAAHEARFLSKMQDDDGGFYFLVYPKDRPYELEVTPEHGDPQVVFPKNTSATAAATAALAQIGSSPAFRALDPDAADKFLHQARKGWEFLMRAREAYGEQGAYQKISHYGDAHMDRDEIAWAAAELFLATGESDYQDYLLGHFQPRAESTHLWGWVSLHEGYGNAIRSYALANPEIRPAAGKRNQGFLKACLAELWRKGSDLEKWSQDSAYGLSYPTPSKEAKTAGWHFATADMFDAVCTNVARESGQLNDAILANLEYELGANPDNVVFLTGLGHRRQFEIVHQWGQNDGLQMPIAGIPLGVLQGGFQERQPYGPFINALTFPPDEDSVSPYPIYDRWGDAYNLTTEFVIVNQARALAAVAYYAGKQDSGRPDPIPMSLDVTGLPSSPKEGEPISLSLESTRPLTNAMVIWEISDLPNPLLGSRITYTPQESGSHFLAVEAQWPDGHRAYERREFSVARAQGGRGALPLPETTLLIHGDADSPLLMAYATVPATVEASGEAALSGDDLGWMETPKGSALRFKNFTDAFTFHWKKEGVSDPPENRIELSGWFQFERLSPGDSSQKVLSFGSDHHQPLLALVSDYWDQNKSLSLKVFDEEVVESEVLKDRIKPGQWVRLSLTADADGWTLAVEGEEVAQGTLPNPEVWKEFLKSPHRFLEVGHFLGYADDIHLQAKEPPGSR